MHARSIALLMVAILPAIALILFGWFRQQDRAAEQARSETVQLAGLASTEQARLIEQTHQLLIALAHEPSVVLGDTCGSFLAEIQANFPYTANFGVIDRTGKVTCSALPFDPSVNLADRSYFIRAVQNGDFAIGDYQVGRITGAPSINVAYPILDVNGDVRSVVFAALGLSWFSDMAAQADLPDGSTMTVLDASGTVLMRYPSSDQLVGKPFPDIKLLAAARQGKGTYQTSGLDGVDRLYGFTPLTGTGASVVMVGIPSSVAFADANRTLELGLLALAAIAALAIAVAWIGTGRYILKPVSFLSDAASQLGQGDLSTRTGYPPTDDEIGRLAASFDRMAEGLQEREETNRQMQAAITESERRYRQLFREMSSGFALHQMMFDEDGHPTDYRFLDVNPAFEKMVGVTASQIVGRTARELAPEFDETWLETYGRVVQSGESTRFEDLADVIGKTVEVSAFRPQEGEFAALFTDITERKKAEERVRRQLSQLRSLRAIDLAITSSVDSRVTFDVLLGQVTHQLEVDAALIALYDPHIRTLSVVAAHGFSAGMARVAELRIGQGFAGKAALDRVTIAVPALADLGEGDPWGAQFHLQGFAASTASPLLAKGDVKGVLVVCSRTPMEADEAWTEFLEALAGQAAIAVDNANLFEGLRQSNLELVQAYDTTLEGWSKALELRDDETEGHSARVTEMAVRLAKAMGLPPEDLKNIRRGALLHDIGKMGIPNSILLKPGPLTEDEWEVMRKHPVYAYELLSPIGFLRQALDIPYSHHERWDGSGYPQGLKGDLIPLAARIFAVVDVWDALSSDRPYREAWSASKVQEYLTENAGEQFDPRVVEAFIRMQTEASSSSEG